MDLNSIMRELVSNLTNSREFKNMKVAKEVLIQNTEYNAKYEEFKRKQSILYSGNLPPREVETHMHQLNAEYEILKKIPEIYNYLASVDMFNNLLNNLMQYLNDSIEKNL